MNSRLRFVALAVVAVLVGLSSPGSALEKTTARFTDDFDGWRSAGTSSSCLVAYYNTCNGWVWIWGGWAPEDRVGVCFTSCCGGGLVAEVDTSYVHFWTSAPSGYGFTGTVGVYNVDANCCPTGTSLIPAQPLLPISGWNAVGFSPPVRGQDQFAVTFTFGPGVSTPLSLTADHPAMGPTGPVACGTCFPTSRENHSLYYGTTSSPLCPGSSFFDGVCDSQFLWDASMHCVTSTAVESSSWGSIKGLYR